MPMLGEPTDNRPVALPLPQRSLWLLPARIKGSGRALDPRGQLAGDESYGVADG